MISNQRLLARVLLRNSRFGFSSLASIDQTLATAKTGTQDWGKFFQEVKPSDVAGADTMTVSKLLGVLTYAPATDPQGTNLYNAVDEYFRKQFRNLQRDDALNLAIGMNTGAALACLDGSFWVWHTLEEAIRPDLEELS